MQCHMHIHAKSGQEAWSLDHIAAFHLCKAHRKLVADNVPPMLLLHAAGSRNLLMHGVIEECVHVCALCRIKPHTMSAFFARTVLISMLVAVQALNALGAARWRRCVQLRCMARECQAG